MSCDTVTESFIHDFMFTCDTLPSHLCPRCWEIKQNSWVPRVTSLGARPALLCPGARPCMLCHGDTLMAQCPSSHAGEHSKHSQDTQR